MAAYAVGFYCVLLRRLVLGWGLTEEGFSIDVSTHGSASNASVVFFVGGASSGGRPKGAFFFLGQSGAGIVPAIGTARLESVLPETTVVVSTLSPRCSVWFSPFDLAPFSRLSGRVLYVPGTVVLKVALGTILYHRWGLWGFRGICVSRMG